MRLLIAVVLLCFTLPSWAETPIAYWAQNSNQLPNGTNGFTPSSFPQQADVGEGLLYLQNFDQELDDNGVYRTLASFAGSTQNRLDGYPAGRSSAKSRLYTVMRVKLSKLTPEIRILSKRLFPDAAVAPSKVTRI